MVTNLPMQMSGDLVAFTVRALIVAAQAKLRELDGYDQSESMADISMVLSQASRLADALGDELSNSVPVRAMKGAA